MHRQAVYRILSFVHVCNLTPAFCISSLSFGLKTSRSYRITSYFFCFNLFFFHKYFHKPQPRCSISCFTYFNLTQHIVWRNINFQNLSNLTSFWTYFSDLLCFSFRRNVKILKFCNKLCV